MEEYQKEFIEISLDKKALRLYPTKLSVGRLSPYFFNAGEFNDGRSALNISDSYAQAILGNFDLDESYVLFGPAMKGTFLVPAIAVILEDRYAKNVNFASNRKVLKDHGEGTGNDYQGSHLIGYHFKGGEKIIVVDDVITTGDTKISSIGELGNIPEIGSQLEVVGVVTMLDRQEIDESGVSASENFRKRTGIPVKSIIDVGNVYDYLCNPEIGDSEILSKRVEYLSFFGLEERQFRDSMRRYLKCYGTKEIRAKFDID